MHRSRGREGAVMPGQARSSGMALLGPRRRGRFQLTQLLPNGGRVVRVGRQRQVLAEVCGGFGVVLLPQQNQGQHNVEPWDPVLLIDL